MKGTIPRYSGRSRDGMRFVFELLILADTENGALPEADGYCTYILSVESNSITLPRGRWISHMSIYSTGRIEHSRTLHQPTVSASDSSFPFHKFCHTEDILSHFAGVCFTAGQVTDARYHRLATPSHFQHVILHAQSSTASWDLPAGLVFVNNVGVINILSRQEPRHLVAVLLGVALRHLPGSDRSDYRVRRLNASR